MFLHVYTDAYFCSGTRFAKVIIAEGAHAGQEVVITRKDRREHQAQVANSEAIHLIIVHV